MGSRATGTAIGVAALGVIASLADVALAAQAWPARPIRLVVPFAAGAPDSVARAIAPPLAASLGQPVVIDNRPGANGVPGTEAVARAEPDGHTLLMVSSSLVINPSLYRSLPYDVVRDLDPVGLVALSPGYILAVHPSVPAKTVRELVALSRVPGSRLTYASPGHGNGIHLATELFKARTGADLVHAPYRGAGPAIADLVGGHVQVMFVTPPLSMAHIQAGRLRPIAFAGARRWPSLPDVPVMAESGVDGLVIDGGWFGLVAPARTPGAVVQRLSEEVRRALELPEVRERFGRLLLDPVGGTPTHFRQLITTQLRSFAEQVRVAGIEPQ